MALGYRRAAACPYNVFDQEPGALAGSIPGIVSQYVNHNVATLKSPPWSSLLDLLGDDGEDIMIELLMDRAIFVCIENQKQSFVQISGLPLSLLQPLQHNSPDEPPHQARAVRKPNNIVFVRRRILYARPAHNAKGGIRCGLPLNRKSNSPIIERLIL